MPDVEEGFRPGPPPELQGAPGQAEVVMDPPTTVRVPVPVARLDSFVTPAENLYTIAHMGIARLEAGTWELRVEGQVDRPLRFTFEDLRRLPSRTETAVIECFGNPLEPTAPTRRVGNVQWGGVPLGDVLREAGVKPAATCVWLEARDHGTFGNVHSSRYIKDIPLAKARGPEVLLAYELNGAPIPAEHGFPVRAVVPGYFGTNSVKWLAAVTLASTRPESLFTTTLYNRKIEAHGQVTTEPVRDLDAHSVMVRPAEGDALAPGPHAISGWAWSVHEVARVEVSCDGGTTWDEANLERRRGEFTWQAFRWVWEAARPGEHILQCRATDAMGRMQPTGAGRNRIHQVKVTIG